MLEWWTRVYFLIISMHLFPVLNSSDVNILFHWLQATCAIGNVELQFVRLPGVVGRVLALQSSGPNSTPSGVRFEFLSWDWVCVHCVLPCVVFGGGPEIVLTTHSGRPAFMYMYSVLV